MENLGALGLDARAGRAQRARRGGAPTLGFPRSFLESDNVRNLIYGETWERLEAIAR